MQRRRNLGSLVVIHKTISKITLVSIYPPAIHPQITPSGSARANVCRSCPASCTEGFSAMQFKYVIPLRLDFVLFNLCTLKKRLRRLCPYLVEGLRPDTNLYKPITLPIGCVVVLRAPQLEMGEKCFFFQILRCCSSCWSPSLF